MVCPYPEKSECKSHIYRHNRSVVGSSPTSGANDEAITSFKTLLDTWPSIKGVALIDRKFAIVYSKWRKTRKRRRRLRSNGLIAEIEVSKIGSKVFYRRLLLVTQCSPQLRLSYQTALCPAGQSVKPSALQAGVLGSIPGQDTSTPGCTACNKCNPVCGKDGLSLTYG